MRRANAIIATSQVTSHGDRFSVEALEKLASSVSKSYIPVGVEHDPRIPPQGRIQSAWVRTRDDGESEVAAVLEFFEPGDEEHDSEAHDVNRELVAPQSPDGFVVSYDWTHRHDADSEDFDAIAEALNGKLVFEGKNAAEPISVITIIGTFLLGGIASGFLGQIGSDAWEITKARILRVLGRTDLRAGEQLVTFKAVIEQPGYLVEVELVVTNPSEEKLEQIVKEHLITLDKVVPILIKSTADVRRLVFEVKGSELQLLFGVRKDCKPLKATLTVSQILDGIDAP